jgi:butyryl-CoA dehydrogenase
MIHEGTHGIQGMDLLGRKVLMENGMGLQLLAQRINRTIEKALPLGTAVSGHDFSAHANALAQALQRLGRATKMAWSTGEPREALANAVPYLQAFGHTVLAWMWLELALASQANDAANKGRLAAARYFFHYELPKTGAWLNVVETRDMTCADVSEDSF